MQIVLFYVKVNFFKPLITLFRYVKLILTIKLFLKSLHINIVGDMVLMCISKMFNTIMRMNYSVEQDQRIERCLAIFLAPSKPFSQEIRFVYFSTFKLIMCVTENVQAQTTFLKIFCVVLVSIVQLLNKQKNTSESSISIS